MSLLTIVQGAFARLNLNVPSAVVANTTKEVVEMYNLAKEEGKALARRATWKALQAEKTFTTTVAAAQTSALPSDFDWMLPDTMFNRTKNRRVDGPIEADEWQLIQSSLVTRVFPAFRIRGTSLLLTPSPTVTTDTIAYEYMTKNWCTTSGGTGQATWAADSDLAVLDDEFHTLGIMWRFLKMRGLDYGDHFAAYEHEVKQAMARDGARPRLNLNGVPARGRGRSEATDWRVTT